MFWYLREIFLLKDCSFTYKNMTTDHNPVIQLQEELKITIRQDKDLANVMGISLNQLYAIYNLIYNLAGPTTNIDRNLTLTWYLIKGGCSDMEIDSDEALHLWEIARAHYNNLVSSGSSQYEPLVSRLDSDILILMM